MTPAPDKRYETFQPVSIDIRIMTVGMTAEATVEVLASSADRWFRFSLPTHSKVIRVFLRETGIRRDADRMWVGIKMHPDPSGCGPFRLDGLVVGEDDNGTAVVDQAQVR